MTGRDRYEIILAGSGGQGLVVSGIMLGEAAILDGKNVVQTVSYGIASRGGFSQAEVIIDREEIIFQQVEQPDVVLALTEEAMDISFGFAAAGTLVFYDSTLLRNRTGTNLHGYPFTRMAADHGQATAANMIALGAITAATGMVNSQSLVKVIRKRFAPEIAEMNIAALHSGAGLVPAAAGRR